MLVFICIFIFGISTIAAINEDYKIPKPHRNDNFMLEPLLKPSNNNSKLLRQEIKKQGTIDDGQKHKNDEKVFTIFTDFIQVLIKILLKYTDADLKEFFVIFNEEAREFNYAGCHFDELTDNYDLGRVIDNNLNRIKKMPAAKIREYLNRMKNKLKSQQYLEYNTNFVSYLNSLFNKSDIQKLNKVLGQLDNYRSKTNNNEDLIQIIRKGLRVVVFDHYSELNDNSRMEFKDKMNKYWDYLKGLRANRNSKYKITEKHGEETRVKDQIRHVTPKDNKKVKNKRITEKQSVKENNLDLKHKRNIQTLSKRPKSKEKVFTTSTTKHHLLPKAIKKITESLKLPKNTSKGRGRITRTTEMRDQGDQYIESGVTPRVEKRGRNFKKTTNEYSEGPTVNIKEFDGNIKKLEALRTKYKVTPSNDEADETLNSEVQFAKIQNLSTVNPKKTSEIGIAISQEYSEELTTKMQRKKPVHPPVNTNTDSKVSMKIQQLVDEIKVLKSQIKNDTDIINDLNIKLQEKSKINDDAGHVTATTKKNKPKNKNTNKIRTPDYNIDAEEIITKEIKKSDLDLEDEVKHVRDSNEDFKENNKYIGNQYFDSNQYKEEIMESKDVDKIFESNRVSKSVYADFEKSRYVDGDFNSHRDKINTMPSRGSKVVKKNTKKYQQSTFKMDSERFSDSYERKKHKTLENKKDSVESDYLREFGKMLEDKHFEQKTTQRNYNYEDYPVEKYSSRNPKNRAPMTTKVNSREEEYITDTVTSKKYGRKNKFGRRNMENKSKGDENDYDYPESTLKISTKTKDYDYTLATPTRFLASKSTTTTENENKEIIDFYPQSVEEIQPFINDYYNNVMLKANTVSRNSPIKTDSIFYVPTPP